LLTTLETIDAVLTNLQEAGYDPGASTTTIANSP
jgi:hypothetical protein